MVFYTIRDEVAALRTLYAREQEGGASEKVPRQLVRWLYKDERRGPRKLTQLGELIVCASPKLTAASQKQLEIVLCLSVPHRTRLMPSDDCDEAGLVRWGNADVVQDLERRQTAFQCMRASLGQAPPLIYAEDVAMWLKDTMQYLKQAQCLFVGTLGLGQEGTISLLNLLLIADARRVANQTAWDSDRLPLPACGPFTLEGVRQVWDVHGEVFVKAGLVRHSPTFVTDTELIEYCPVETAS